MTRAQILFQLSAQFNTIKAGHDDITDNYAWPDLSCLFNPVFTVFCFSHSVLPAQTSLHVGPEFFIILHNENDLPVDSIIR